MATSTENHPDAIKASIFQRLHPRIYFERFVSENIRPDGRDFDAWRDVSVNVGMNTLIFVKLVNLTSPS
jgi:exosome complex component RRP43